MVKYKLILTFLLIQLALSGLLAQEVLRGLSVNPELLKKNNTQASQIKLKSQSSLNNSLNYAEIKSDDILNIPFIDDFSSTTVYPNSTLWDDSTVLINSKYSIGPPTKGVATFDALNKKRQLYDTVYSKPFYADTLTSKPINLNYPGRKDIFLSFFYQPQGGGVVAPATGDSLMLEFFRPDSVRWEKVWAVPGSSVQPFKEVLLQVDTPYLQQGFRFRFRNIASVDSADSSRLDKVALWHIDNVKLDKGRNANDTLLWYITIPFMDDFSSSTSSVYPDQNRWSDRYAYINSTYPVDPPSVGVATLDAIDENGLIYSRATSEPFYADQLTSKPINMAFPARNDIFLSFFYQPQGIGDSPETGDSLMVDFYNPSLADSIAWTKVWAVPGDSVYPFKQAVIKVDTGYQQKGFCFRFRNIASISPEDFYPGKHGNFDQWHIDYVRLDTGRNANDTIIDDVAFVKPLTSLLQTYQSMPWEHFVLAFRNEIKPNISITFKNNNYDPKGHSVVPSFEVKDLYSGQISSSFSTGRRNLEARETQTIEPDLTNPFTTSSTDSALFEVKSYFLDNDKSDYNKWNDTIRFLQVFNDYFALDDGTSEAGYGLQGQGSLNAMVAYSFTSYQLDTLTAISIYFNPTEQNITTTDNYYFKLAVWADNNGKPGKFLFLEANDNYKPIKLGQFYPYKLDTGLLVNGKFYVGWVQINENFLNVGFDLNNNNQSKHFVNLTGTWINSGFKGSMMIRPIFRTKKIVVSSKPLTTPTLPVDIYPNPASNFITIDTGIDSGENNWIISVFNISGKQIIKTALQGNTLDVSSLPNGLYILKMSGTKTNLQPVKLLIQR